MPIVDRRRFLSSLGLGIGGVALGAAIADRAGFARAFAAFAPERLRFGALDPLVDRIQDMESDALVRWLVEQLRSGLALDDVVGATALANARALGGTNYNGYHALMALVPGVEMAAQMPQPLAALPVLKVVHRNSRFIRDAGGRDSLAPIEPADGDAAELGRGLPGAIGRLDREDAERRLVAVARRSPAEAQEALQESVRQDINVHRVVLAWRAFDLLRFAGEANAPTLLRQTVRFCIDEDGQRERRGQARPEIGPVVARLLEECHLEGREPGVKRADDAFVDELARTVFSAERAAAGAATADALAEGVDPEVVGEAISLAAARLVLHDRGRPEDSPGKPRGSVHGASTGVHASDSANAWRQLARSGGARNRFASLIAGAYHTAGQAQHVAAQPFDQDGPACVKSDPAELLAEIDGCIRGRDQKGAMVATRRYCALGHSDAELLARMREFSVEFDGALHAEKYFRTVQQECAAARPAHRPLHLAALARVLASSAGFPSEDCVEARRLLTA